MSVSFDFKRRLGEGYFGEVWHAIDTGLGCEVALKCIPPDKIINKGNFYQEAQMLKASEHPNIVKVNDTGNLDDGRIYVSMEYLPKGSLEDEAQGAPIILSRVKRIMIDLLRGLEFAHSKRIVHRDIKPANILIGNTSEGILSDFGLALPDISTIDFTKLKQYQYMLHLAPEVNKPDKYTYLSDIYACGTTLYRLVNGDQYLPQVRPRDLRKQIISGKYPSRSKYRDFVPTSLRRIINKALNVDPKNRYASAEKMRNALEQQWFDVDWTESNTSTGKVWTGLSKNHMNYRVRKDIQKPYKKRWFVEVKKGKKIEKLRKYKEYCNDNLSKGEATIMAKRILQDLVAGKG